MMTSKENNVDVIKNDKMFDKKDITKLGWRSLLGGFSINWDRLVHKTFFYMISPFLRKIYADDEAAYIESLERNMEFFNVTPQVHAFLGGLTVAMEEENAKNPDFDTSTIPAVKAALMGPLSGIADSIFPGTWRIICAGIGISMAMQGKILGPILYALMYNIPSYYVRFKGAHIGYDLGAEYLDKIQESGLMEKIMMAASTLGLIVIGGMSASMVWTNFTLSWGVEESITTLQQTIDGIFPGLASLGVIMLFYWLLGKKTNTFILIIGTMVVCILLTYLGVMGQ